jgi:hypothetical protein
MRDTSSFVALGWFVVGKRAFAHGFAFTRVCLQNDIYNFTEKHAPGSVGTRMELSLSLKNLKGVRPSSGLGTRFERDLITLVLFQRTYSQPKC